MKTRRLLPLFTGGILILALTAGCASPTTPGATTPPAEKTASRHAVSAASYDDVYNALQNAVSQQQTAAAGSSGTNLPQGISGSAGAAVPPSPTPVPVPPADSGTKYGPAESTAPQSQSYSQTNIQEEGVDEGDIVKTDGQYIYILRQNQLIIFKADGASTVKISTLKVCNDTIYNMPNIPAGQETSEGTGYVSETASDIYVSGNTAVVVTSSWSSIPYSAPNSAEGPDTADIQPEVNSKQISRVYMIDITDRSKPTLKTELGQDGTVLTSRLIGRTLYLISNYNVFNSIQENENGSFVPRLYAGAAATAVSYKSIALMPEVSSAAYIIVGAYDLDKGVLQSNQSILGGGTTVYMTKDALYIAGTTSKQTAGQPYTDSIYTVIDYSTAAVTDIACLELNGGDLKMKASGSIPGSLYGQFALDAWGGNLRAVTTVNSQSWSEYTDKAKGFVNDVWKDPSTSNALYVLDGNLDIIGSVGDLAPGEQVYSVRFDGPTGYIVTFRQTDPLFAVDLSDPLKPTVKSALKISGFSDYLHVYGDGLLLGLGMAADDSTGRTDGMKLTMFDTSNPEDVTIKHTLKLDTNWSAALYSHKAILISPDKSIIAFPVDSGYDIYGYSDEQGFFKRAHIGSFEWNGDGCGLYIGDAAYIIDSACISVLDMTGFKLLNTISY